MSGTKNDYQNFIIESKIGCVVETLSSLKNWA